MNYNEETKVYVVTRTRNRRMQNAYFDSRKEAEEAYNISCKEGWNVEMLYGTPGHYETVKSKLSVLGM